MSQSALVAASHLPYIGRNKQETGTRRDQTSFYIRLAVEGSKPPAAHDV